MASPSNTTMEDLKTLILAVDSKVNKFNEKLDTIENKFSNLVQEVKQESKVRGLRNRSSIKRIKARSR